jgi:prepilin-type N-terminal cleavage/methylation domain-containing protein
MLYPRRRAFTLVELLVVITILLLLAALLMPMLQKAADSAKESLCANDLKLIGSAFGAYAGENNDYIPKAATTTTPRLDGSGNYVRDSYGNVYWNWGLSWETVLLQGGYIPHQGQVNSTLWHTKAFICPLDRRTSQRDFLTSFFMPTCYSDIGPIPAGLDKSLSYSHSISAGVLDGCYHYSDYDTNTQQWDAYPGGLRDAPMPQIKRSRIGDPSGTLQLIEGIGLWYYDWWDSSEAWGPDNWTVSHGQPYYPDSSYCRRHRGGQFGLMCDNSVRWLKVEDTVGTTFSKVFHDNNLNWDTYDIWSYTYRDQLYSNGIRGMWSMEVGD